MPKRLAALAAILPALVQVAEAKPARCFATDEGEYSCDFIATDSDGSFEISAPGRPTYSLVMDAPGAAFGFVNLGGRNVSLPGRFRRSEVDRACWVNDDTRARICAW